MKSIKIALLALFTLLGTAGLTQKGDKAAKRTARMDTLLIKKLELSDAEQKAFIPLYHSFIAEKKALRTKFKPKNKRKKMEDLSDAETEEIIQKKMAFTQAQLDLKKKYHEKYKTALPIKKIAKLYHVEKNLQSRANGRNKGKGKRKGRK